MAKSKNTISKKEARIEARRIVASLAYYDAEASVKFGDLTDCTETWDIKRVEEQFYAIIRQLER